MPIPAIIPAIVAAAGAIGGASIQAVSAKKNRESQEKQNAIDRQRAASAYRTAVSDMRAAGMNPITGQNPPQAASTPMPAPQSDMSGVAQVVQQGASAVGDLLQRNQQAQQDQAMSFYQNQVNSTNDMINKLQDITHQYQSDINQYIEGLSVDAKAYLNELEQELVTYTEKIDSIEDTRLYSTEDLKKYGVTISDKSSTGKSTSEQTELGGSAEISFNWTDPVTTIIDNLTNSSSKETAKVPNKKSPSVISTEEKNAQREKKEHGTKEEGSKKGFHVGAEGSYYNRTGEQNSETHEKGEVTNDETSYSQKTVTGKALKHALRSSLKASYKAKTQDTGSSTLNEKLSTLDKDSYSRLMFDIVDSKLELKKYREYASDLRKNPGDYLESYGKYIDGLRSNNKNPYKFPDFSSYDLDLRKRYASYTKNYPSLSGLMEDHPKLFDPIAKELNSIEDPQDRETAIKFLGEYLKGFKKKLEDAKKGIFVF